MDYRGADTGGTRATPGDDAVTVALPILSAFLVFAGTVFSVGLTRQILARRRILDIPNERSSHSTPTPRGGGIGVLAILLPAWVFWGLYAVDGSGRTTLVVVSGALFLAVMSWLDDLRGLGALSRLVAQFVVAGLGVWVSDGLVFNGLLPGFLDGLMATVLLVWFINLFNFMDGIDGISGVEALVIGIGIFFVGGFTSRLDGGANQALMVAMAALGFLTWNWPPARVFIGDVGSTVLGFLLGWLLLQMAAAGYWLSALILPLYYLADSGLTLARRLLRGENIARAHKTHFYQKAVQNGHGHGTVSLAVFGIGVLLIVHAVVAAQFAADVAWPVLISAIACVGLLLTWMRGGK